MITRQPIIFLFLSALLLSAGCNRGRTAPAGLTTYAEGLCNGRPGWSVVGSQSGELATYNHLEVMPSGTFWNGVAVDQETLQIYLGQVRALSPRLVTALVPDPRTTCGDVIVVRRMMEEQLRCSVERHCVEYSEAEWVRRHPPVN